MNVEDKIHNVQCIAVTLDAFGLSASALDQAVRLAARMGARLEGIFVEDIELLQLAELPFIREVRLQSRSEANMNPARMEQEFRVLARRAERLLGEKAARHNVNWTFRIWRGSIDSDLLNAVMDADVLSLTRLGARLAYAPVARAGRSGIAVLFNGSAASMRALDTAAKLAQDPHVRLDVLLCASGKTGSAALRQQAQHQLGNESGGINYISLPDDALPVLLDVLTDTNSAALILERENRLLHTPALRHGLNNLDCSLLIVR
jgi:nucleotide-binding universal stress UspA family protein